MRRNEDDDCYPFQRIATAICSKVAHMRARTHTHTHTHREREREREREKQ
jgi:hypothetical protein